MMGGGPVSAGVSESAGGGEAVVADVAEGGEVGAVLAEGVVVG